MANLYTAQQLGIQAPAGGFQNGGWYSGRQYINGQFSDAGVINPLSTQQGAGQAVSSEVNRQSDAAQGLKPGTIDNYVAQQNQQQQQQNNTPFDKSAVYGDVPAGGGDAGGGGTGTGLGIGNTAAPTLNLPDLYTSLSANAGITDLENELSTKEKSYNDAQSKINDNPYLSEASRTGRIQKLTTDYNNDIKNTQDTLAMKKQDVQTQLDLQSKQFDINSQQAKAALDQFNTLLSSGALSGASGNDIAAITKATGISSSEIQAAIKAQNAKNIQTSVIQYDDGKNQGFAVVNTQTGDIISRSTIAASKPASTGSALTNESKQLELDKAQAPSAAYAAAKAGKTLPDMISFYAQYGMSPQDVYDIYNSVNYYKATTAQAKADQKKYNVK